MSDTKRTPPADLLHQTPCCTMCYQDTVHDDNGWHCDHCDASWPLSGEQGSWDDPAAEQCPAEWQTTLVPDYWPVYRCALADQHEVVEHRDKNGADWREKHPYPPAWLVPLVDGHGERLGDPVPAAAPVAGGSA